MQALVDSKANLEARDQVAMWPVQPGACSTSGGGGDAVESLVRVGCPAVRPVQPGVGDTSGGGGDAVEAGAAAWGTVRVYE